MERNRERKRGWSSPMTDGAKGASVYVCMCVCRVHFYLFWETAPLTKRPDKRIRRGIEETIGYLLADAAAEEGEWEAEKSGIP